MSSDQPGPGKMRPRTNNNASRRWDFGREMPEGGDRPGQVRVIPAADKQHRHVCRSGAESGRNITPVSAARRIVEPGPIVRVTAETLDVRRPRRDGRMKRQGTGGAKESVEGLVVAGEPRGLGADLGSPTQSGGEAKRVIFISPIVTDIPSNHRRC